MRPKTDTAERGFTLVEIAIVLVIIGLLVGGALVGQSLLKAAEVRATISQIEKFNTAANTFFGKYGYLPGDIPSGPAAQFGFTPRGMLPGQGDGNGFIQGNGGTAYGCGAVQDIGETVLFWEDLTYANGQKLNLIEGSFNQAATGGTFIGSKTGSSIGNVLPLAKIGGGNYFYAYSTACSGPLQTDKNYYGLSAVSSIYPDVEDSCGQCLLSAAALTVKQAYDIDTKIDDGVPTVGNVIAQYLAPNVFAAGGYGMAASASSPSATTCYDTSSGSAAYSISYQNGSNVNCALSFKMQAGD